MTVFDASAIVKVCKDIVDTPYHQGTPREKYNIQKLLDADARGDAEDVVVWAERIHRNFQLLHNDFQMVMFVHMLRSRVGLHIIIVVLNESAPPHAHIPPIYPDFQFSYGNLKQQHEAWGNGGVPETLVVETLARWRKGIERHTFYELLLDPSYYTARMQAACRAANLTDELVRDCDWDGLLALLDQDEAICDSLITWLLQSPELYPFLQAAKEIIKSRIAHLRSIAYEPQSVGSDPPPAYSTADPNAPTTLPSLPAAFLNSTSTAIDRVRSGFRRAFGYGDES